MPSNPVHDKLIVALDVSSGKRAVELVRALRGEVGWYKIGLQLFTAEGPAAVQQVLAEGTSVFLDLKFHDIPNTVRGAVIEAARLGVGMMTLHTLGGVDMMRAAREALATGSDKEGWPCPALLGVTVLTSMDEQALSGIGIAGGVEAAVQRLARSAVEASLEGLVSSPHELPLLQGEPFDKLLRVIPGIRADNAAGDDQARTMSASRALAAGADFLVVGRPITGAADPARAVRELFDPVGEGAGGESR